MIYARFVLHTCCEKNNICIDEECVWSHIQVPTAAQYKDMPSPVYSCNSSEREVIRDRGCGTQPTTSFGFIQTGWLVLSPDTILVHEMRMSYFEGYRKFDE